jgi:hypothetical protein
MKYKYVFTTCNNCGAITALVDLENHEQSSWSWYDKRDEVLTYTFTQQPCCGSNANSAVCLHFTNNTDILFEEEEE